MSGMWLSIVDSLLLFALSIPVVMKYRILPVDGTPYWLFGLLFFLLSLHCLISFYPELLGKYKKHLQSVKLGFIVATLIITVGGATMTAMFDRAKTAPVYGVHDIILQQEAAMRYLIVGKNPYKETYFGTPVESFHYAELGRDAVNPALYHFVMPPWYLLFPFVFYYTGIPVFGFFDGRMASLFTMGMLLLFLWYWFRDKGVSRLAIVITALSPSVVEYFVEGRSDVFALSWLVGALLFLSYKKYAASSAVFALALLSKQTIWFMAPFYLAALWITTSARPRVFVTAIAIMAGIGIALTAPFLLWDARAFIESVILYLSGGTATSYPVSGYGLGMVLFDAGVITDIHAYYPFIYWQIAFAVPLFIVLLRWYRGKPVESRMIVSYAVFLTVYWYMSRYFNNSHLGYLSMVYALGGLKVIDEKGIHETA
jgi:hypothetical protein